MKPVNEHGDIAISAYRKMEADLYDQIYDLQFENAHLRVELEKQAVCNGKGSEREAALLAKVETLERENAALRAAAVETCAIARVWATVWHDKLSTDSLQRFAELEQQILKKAQP